MFMKNKSTTIRHFSIQNVRYWGTVETIKKMVSAALQFSRFVYNLCHKLIYYIDS